jgi:UDP-N-acetylmuramoylalanine--D-glutamate ligase
MGLRIPEASDEPRLEAVAAGFDALPSRFRSLGHVGAVEFVDDGLSTNVLPAQAALAAFADRPVALLVGGHDRGVDYTPLAETVAAREWPTLVVTMPDNGPRIGDAVRAVGADGVEVVDAYDLEAAVAVAFGWSTAGGVILLSPAAPSFGRFGDYRERSAAFAAAAARYGLLS